MSADDQPHAIENKSPDWPAGELQSVRDAYDRLLAEQQEGGES